MINAISGMPSTEISGADLVALKNNYNIQSKQKK